MLELPEYVLTRHAKAKQLRLSVNAIGKLKVTAPKRASLRVIQQFVADNAEWIQSTIRRQQDSRLLHPDLGMKLPEKVLLKAMEKTVELSANLSENNSIREKDTILYLYGRNETSQLELLRDWIKETARDFLNARLAKHAEIMGLSYNRVFIKNQRSRWGSCSIQKNINLNQNLVFFDVNLVDYLLIHELSHLSHPNHSANFWQNVEKFDPQYRVHDRGLSKAAKAIPLWALPLE